MMHPLDPVRRRLYEAVREQVAADLQDMPDTPEYSEKRVLGYSLLEEDLEDFEISALRDFLMSRRLFKFHGWEKGHRLI